MRFLLFVCALVAFARPAGAVVVEIPVPGLTGTYVHEGRTATVHLPALPSAIHGVSLRLVGTTDLAEFACNGSEAVAFVIHFNAGFVANPGFWVAEGDLSNEGAVTATQPFGPIPDVPAPSWAFLLDGVADLSLGCASCCDPFSECVRFGPDESTVLTEVTLLIDGEFPTPAPAVSWGGVKAIYR
jgi:hypothetical protein